MVAIRQGIYLKAHTPILPRAILLRLLVALVVLAATVAPALGQAPTAPKAEAPKLEELDALRIGKLAAERQAVLEEYRRVQFEQANRERVFTEKGAALNALIGEAAAKAKLDLKDGWKPDPDGRVWVK